MRISDWSSDVCSSDLLDRRMIGHRHQFDGAITERGDRPQSGVEILERIAAERIDLKPDRLAARPEEAARPRHRGPREARSRRGDHTRSEERRVGKEDVRTFSYTWYPYH